MRLTHFRISWVAQLLTVLALATAAESQQRPRILVSNDDGVNSEGIAALADALDDFAEVVVVAPGENESGASHRTVIRVQTTTLTPIAKDGRAFGWAIDGSPADAVKFGILHFGAERPFDLVVSGINDGANVGLIAHSSGTVGAAMEALLNGIPALAVSQGSRGEFEVSARFSAEVVKQVLERGLEPGVLLSVNVPAGELKGVRIAPMDGLYFRVSGLTEVGTVGESTQFRARVSGAYGVTPGSDTEAYLDGWVTVTPLQIDWTHAGMLREVEGWGLRLEP